MASDRSGPDRPISGSPSGKSAQTEMQTGTPAGIQPDNATTQSPWWTAPAGRPVDIPAFGRTILEWLAELLLPAPRPVPVKVRVTARRR